MKAVMLSILAVSFLIGGDSRFQRVNDVVIDNYSNLMWQKSDDGVQKDWFEAKNYCQDLKLKGYDDWRLPSIDELMSIIDKKKYSPAIDTDIFDCKNAYYWSATETNNNSEKSTDARGVLFKNGFNITYMKNYKDYVRCVRSVEKKN